MSRQLRWDSIILLEVGGPSWQMSVAIGCLSEKRGGGGQNYNYFEKQLDHFQNSGIVKPVVANGN
ncbi:hypothetical protein, partial [Secundilactobacillus paracollinoides]|uniref:hypothetical protein n=1 Tax=Secundilactobacillus paracollinoides TaxID=240427 RepID=UPI001F3785B4